ncbi:hypothetical protein L2E82_25796 [Cichorium intybus]|uniref:Uncharacterized protein n=1 Tax=Cichorium intybus TaxID=13427 RepID=A0ACB9E4H5_CICIN|nr:hypothetical protein L2E82_25796 [Cichorium intybus]
MNLVNKACVIVTLGAVIGTRYRSFRSKSHSFWQLIAPSISHVSSSPVALDPSGYNLKERALLHLQEQFKKDDEFFNRIRDHQVDATCRSHCQRTLEGDHVKVAQFVPVKQLLQDSRSNEKIPLDYDETLYKRFKSLKKEFNDGQLRGNVFTLAVKLFSPDLENPHPEGQPETQEDGDDEQTIKKAEKEKQIISEETKDKTIEKE